MAITPADWGRRVQITEVATTAVSESGYVGLLTEANMPAEIWSLAENGGGDLRVCLNSDGTSQLPLEVVSFDTVGETAVLWFRFPTFVSGDSVWLFYDKAGDAQPAVTGPFGRNAVWQNIEHHYHGDSLTDVTGNGYDLSTVGAGATVGNGSFLGGFYSSGYTEGFEFTGGTSSVTTSQAATISKWVRRTSVDPSVNNDFNQQIATWYNAVNSDGFGISYGQSGSIDNKNFVFTNGGNTLSSTSGTAQSLNQWHKVDIVFDQPNNQVLLYLDGVLDLSVSSYSDNSSFGQNLYLDNAPDSNGGIVGDSTENSFIVGSKSSDYIATEYANQSSPATFWSTGTPESTTGGGVTYSITLDPGAYTYTGSAVTLQAARSITLDAGSYAYTGSAQTLAVNRKLALDSASYAYTGQDVTLKASRAIALDAGAYTYTGEAVALTYNPATGATYTIALDAGAYTLTGQDVSLAASRKLALDPASYSLTGSAVTLRAARSLSVEGGAFVVTGNAVALSASRSITLEQGSYALTGSPVTLSYSGEVIALVSGYSVNYKQDDVSGGYANDYIQARFQ